MAALVLSLTAHAAMALELKTVPTADGSGLAQATVESVDYRVKIIFSRGARIAELTDLKLNVNGVAWRQTVGNGFLGDRHVFTEAEYQTKRPQVTPNRVTIPSKVRADDGVELTKTFVFEKSKPFVRVIYEVRNHGLKPYTLWVKNLGVPCGGERTKGDVSVTFQTQGELRTFDPWPSHFYPEVHGGWMALHRRTRKAGYFVRADPAYLDRFYFWPKSAVTPTFEWTYKPVAPGQSFRTTVLLGLLRDCDKVGWIGADGVVSATERKPAQPKAPSYAKIEGWMSLDEIYQPTEAERARGFIVTQMSSRNPRERLQSLAVDVGMDEGELVPVEVFGLKKIEGLRLELAGDAARDPSLRPESEINYRLTPGGAGATAMGSYGRLWLRVLPSETPRSVTGALVVAGPDGRMELPLRFRVWPIKLPKQSMLPFNRTRKGSSTSRHRSELRASRWSRYRNGGAINTYCFARPYDPFPPEIRTEQIEELVVFADGKPLDMLTGRSPWGNKKEGVSFRLGKMIYVSLPQGQAPHRAKIVIEYTVRRVEATGKPTVELKHRDSQWYYGGGGGYFRDDYLRMRRYTWIGCHYGLAGRAHYVFYHWVAKRRLVWYEKGKPLVFSPAYEGLRDAAEDSAYYRKLETLGAPKALLWSAFGPGEEAALRLVETRQQAYAWDDVDPRADYDNYNLAKQRMLKALVQLEGAGKIK